MAVKPWQAGAGSAVQVVGAAAAAAAAASHSAVGAVLAQRAAQPLGVGVVAVQPDMYALAMTKKSARIPLFRQRRITNSGRTG
jgi:hypothetical protein